MGVFHPPINSTENPCFWHQIKCRITTRFDEKGNLISITNKEGKKITVERDSKGFTVTDAASKRKLSYSLNEDSLVKSVKDGNGREAKFYYDENKCLKQFTNAMGENTYYTYDEGHRILTVTDNDNNTYVTNTYKEYDSVLSAAGKVTRVESQKDGLNHKTGFAYKEDEESGDTVTTATTRSGQKKKTVTDAYGNITCITNEAGDETCMTYDEDGNQTSVSNANGYDTVYKYDSNGNMTSIENSLMDGSLAETAMTYDSDGNMLSMKNASGESMQCTYYENGLIKSVADQNGNTTHYTYNDNGQITEEKDAAGKTVKYAYNDKGDLVSVTDKNNNVTEYTYSKTGLQTGVTVKDGEQVYKTQTFYDDLGRVDYMIDTEGGITAYEYDCAGNVTSRTDPGGAMTVYAYDGNYQMVKETVYTSEDGETVSSTTDYSYTKEGLLKKVTDAESGTVIENTYDAVGNKTKETEKDKNGRLLCDTRYEYDKAGNVTKETLVNVDPKEGEPESLSAEYNYYPNGKLNYAVDTAGNRTTYSYDRSWRVQTIVSDTEPSVTYKYDAAGRVLSETLGGRGGEVSETSYTYDIYGNVKTATDPAGHMTTYTYDGNGNLTETKDVTGRVFYSRYDALNRVTEEGMRAPSAPGTDIPLAGTSYNINTHTVTRTDRVNGGSVTTLYDAAGRPVKTTNKEGEVLSETIYDTEGRILQTVDAKRMVTEYVYSSLMQIEKTRTGEKGTLSDGVYILTGEIRETAYAYDDLGRNTKVTDAADGVSSVVFDGLGRITSLKDPNQNRAGNKSANTYEYTYNEKGLVEKEKNAIGNVTEYQYNDSMLLSQIKDSAGEKTTYRYDGLNRIKSVSDGLGTITYTYDANGNITDVTEKSGVLENLFGSGETIHREFDSLNRVTKYVDCNGHEVKYGYDELGNMKTLAYPGGEIVTYTYHDDGSVKTMESSSGGTFIYGYDNYGRLCKITRADGSTEERKYDAAGQLISQTDTDKNGNILQQSTYEYDIFGEMTTKTTSNAQNPGVLTTATMTYDDANRLKTYNGEAVRYDEKGNMTYGPVDGKMQELTYDCRNRLVEAGGITYTYDAENTRIATTEDGITTEYVTDTGGSLSRMITAYEADNTETLYYYGAEGLAAQYNTGTGKYYAYHYDNIGSTTLITDRSGQAVERFSYGTYGELLKDAITKIRFLYNGSYGVATDSNGLYYMRARYYNPDIKRFINQDIKVGDIGSSQSLNRYAYCEGNPVSLVDPFGLSPQGNTGGTIWDILKRELTIHDLLGVAGIIPYVGVAADLIDAAIYLNEGEPLKAALSIVCAIPEIGDIIGIVRKGTELARVAKVVSTSIRTAQKFYVTAASASAALDLAGDAKLEYAVNGGNMTSSVKAKIGTAALMAGLAAVSGKSMMKDVRRMARMADIRFKTTRLERSDAASGKKIRYIIDDIGCFVAGTPVKTADGEKNIEEVQEGDYVLAENPETGEQGYRKVARTFIHEKYIIIHVFIGSEEIETTEEHPFYVEGVGFVAAGELKAGDIIRTADGRNLPIIKVEREELEEPVLVYNFEVEDFHTYYVSEIGVLVHNTCPGETGKNTIGKVVNGGGKDSNIPLLETSKYISGKVNDHHIIPKFRGKSKKYADFISSRGINVDDYTVTVSAGKDGMHMNLLHGKGGWNRKWIEFIDNNPNATAKDIYQFAGKMMDDYGLSRFNIHPYSKK